MEVVLTQFSSILRTILLLLFVLARESCGIQRFAVEPKSITANLGDRITLPCKILDRKGTVQWTKDGFGLGVNRTLQGFDRYVMSGPFEQGKCLEVN